MKLWIEKKLNSISKIIPQVKSTIPFTKKSKEVFNKDGFQKKKPKKISLTLDEWCQFASLLESGNTLQQCMDMLSLDSAYITSQLEKGISFETLIISNNKGRFYDHLAFFIEVTTLSESITSAMEMMKWESELLKKFRKQSVYPCFILVFSFVSVYLFSQFIIPQLISSFQTNTSDDVLFVVVNLLKDICLFFFLFVFTLVILLCVQKYNVRLHHYFYIQFAPKISWCRQSISYYLSGYFIQLQRKGFSSKQALQYMMKMQKKSHLSYTVQQLYEQLQKGEELLVLLERSPYLDRQFKNYFLIGSHNADLVIALQSYMNIQMIRWDRQLKIITTSIQSTAYVFVGILVVCVYQIMLIPLQMLEQF